MPDFALEHALADGSRSLDARFVIGIDEAGRGPWAGPVVAAAIWLDAERCPKQLLSQLDDSKRLTATRRSELYRVLLDCVEESTAAVGIGRAEAGEIDEINILQASLRAMARATADLQAICGREPGAALVDGNKAPELQCTVRTVVGGDGLSLSIAAASVAAKVVRDRHMEDLAERHPGYGWERNRGYGTAEHRAALQRLGVSPEHRRSYRPVRQVIVR